MIVGGIGLSVVPFFLEIAKYIQILVKDMRDSLFESYFV